MAPRSLNLALIPYIERVYAYLAHIFLKDSLLERADPRLRMLFEWHFAEEIEHKSVVFDVFQAVSGNYRLRLLGAALIIPSFYLINFPVPSTWSARMARCFRAGPGPMRIVF